eukprot:351002-Chlamydomonas_euryale.AAC.16
MAFQGSVPGGPSGYVCREWVQPQVTTSHKCSTQLNNDDADLDHQPQHPAKHVGQPGQAWRQRGWVCGASLAGRRSSMAGCDDGLAGTRSAWLGSRSALAACLWP